MKYLAQIAGRCLEGIGVVNPRYAIIDTEITPLVGDLVHCRRYIGTLDSYIKQIYDYVLSTQEFLVGTRYKDSTKDFSFVAEEINGVVLEIYDMRGRIIYERK